MIKFRIVLLMFILGGNISHSIAQNPDRKYTDEFIRVGAIELPEGPVRFLEDNKGHLIVTVAGKKGLIAVLKDTILEPLAEGFISDAALGPDGNIWYIEKNGIKSVSISKTISKKNLLPLFFRENNPDILTWSDDRNFYRDRLGSLWLLNAPERVCADMKSLPNPKFNHLFPLPQCTDMFGNMWSLITTDEKETKAIGVLPSGETKQWTVFDENNGPPPGQWSSIISDIEGIIWVSGKSGLYSFDPRKPDRGWLPFPSENPYPGGVVSLLTLSSTGRALTALPNGELFELNIDSREVPIINKINTNGLPNPPLNAIYTDKAGRILVVVRNKLYRQDKEESAWQPLTPMPYGNHDLFGVELNGKIYTPGGAPITDSLPYLKILIVF